MKILTALLFVLVLAGSLPASGCEVQACTDDPDVLGNEAIEWEYGLGGGLPDTAEIWVDGRLCLTVLYPVSSTVLPPDCRGDAVMVRACNVWGCGGFSNPVEAWPYMCIEGNQEVACFPGAPLRRP